MRFAITGMLSLLLLTVSSCNFKEKEQSNVTPAENVGRPFSPIEGNWILVSNEVYGKQIPSKRFPQQLKMFHDGFFSFVMYDSLGNFYYAGAGPYELNGNIYKETFTYSSDTSYIDSKDWQQWELKGDTLIFYGFERAELANGKDVTEEWGGRGKFIEKRVKATK